MTLPKLKIGLPGSSQAYGILAMLAAVVLWSIMAVYFARVQMNPLAVGAIGYAVLAPAYVLLAKFRGHSPTEMVRKVGLRRYLAIALVGILNGIFYVTALQNAPTGPVLVLCMTSPLMLMFAGIVRGRRRINLGSVTSLFLVSLALFVLLVSYHGDEGRGNLSLGLICAVLAAASGAMVLSLNTSSIQGLPTTAYNAPVQVIGLISMSPVLVLSEITLDQASIVVLASLASIASSLLYFAAIRRLPPVTSSSLQLTKPFGGSLVAFWFFGTAPSFAQIVMVILVAGAVYLELEESKSASTDLEPTQEDLGELSPREALQ